MPRTTVGMHRYPRRLLAAWQCIQGTDAWTTSPCSKATRRRLHIFKSRPCHAELRHRTARNGLRFHVRSFVLTSPPPATHDGPARYLNVQLVRGDRRQGRQTDRLHELDLDAAGLRRQDRDMFTLAPSTHALASNLGNTVSSRSHGGRQPLLPVLQKMYTGRTGRARKSHAQSGN